MRSPHPSVSIARSVAFYLPRLPRDARLPDVVGRYEFRRPLSRMACKLTERTNGAER
jgi:hypothetical protein